jgi:PAS domain S-box-containing protein
MSGMYSPKSSDPALDQALKANGLEWDAFSEILLDASKSGCTMVAKDGTVLYANRMAREKIGIPPGARLAQSVPELLERVRLVLAGEKDLGGDFLRRREATYLTKVSLIANEAGVLGALCVFIDMTRSEAALDQMRAYEELARQQDAIIDSLAEGIWISDGQANVLRINPASERLNDVRADQVVGRNMVDLVEEGLFDRSATLEVLRQKAPVSMLQIREGRQLVLTGIPVMDEAGALIRVVVTERDITEIEALNRELEEKEAMKDRYRDHLLELQLEELESRRVIARSPCMQKALHHAIKVAKVDSTVLLLGESGVGKELFADVIYKHSDRVGKPLVKINCGAIPESLLEAELFGYEKGAFTGAQDKGKPGYFELADGGILFLDEIAELTLASQVKLLRFLEDGRVTRVGATRSRQLDVRILAATHQDLQAMVERGAFRLDLFYRLSVIPIAIPPLRERSECILPLLRHYTGFFAERMGVSRRFSRAASEALIAYPWRGNVRELANLCERLVVMSESELIGLADLPPDILGQSGPAALAQDGPESLTLNQVLDSTERRLLLDARQIHGSQTLMAKALGIDQSTVARKLKKHGIT